MPEHEEDPLQRIEDELRASRARLTGRPLPSADPTLFGETAFEDAWPESAVEAEVPFLGVDDHPTVDLQADLTHVEPLAEGAAGPEATTAPLTEEDLFAPPIVDIPVLREPEDFVVEVPPATAPRAREPEPTQPLVMGFPPAPAFLSPAPAEPPTPIVASSPEPDVAPEPTSASATVTAPAIDVLAEIGALGRRLMGALDEVAERQDRLEAMLLAQQAIAGSATPSSAPAPSASAPSEMEEWSMALARLVRADSEAIRTEVQRIATEQRDALAALDHLREADVRVLNQRIDETLLRIDSAVFRLGDSIERRLSSALDALEYATQAARQADRAALLATVEDRVEALARLIRSDHEHLAATVAADQEASKQALRSAKEVQASLPREIADAIDRRLAGFARSLDV